MTLIAQEIDMTRTTPIECQDHTEGSTTVHEIEVALAAACEAASGTHDRATLEPLGKIPFDPELFVSLREALGYRHCVHYYDGDRMLYTSEPDREADAYEEKLDMALCYWRAGNADEGREARFRQIADYLEAAGRVGFETLQTGRGAQ